MDAFTVTSASTKAVFKHKRFFFSFKIDCCSYQNDYREETATHFEGSVSVAQGQWQIIISGFQRDSQSDQRHLC